MTNFQCCKRSMLLPSLSCKSGCFWCVCVCVCVAGKMKIKAEVVLFCLSLRLLFLFFFLSFFFTFSLLFSASFSLLFLVRIHFLYLPLFVYIFSSCFFLYLSTFSSFHFSHYVFIIVLYGNFVLRYIHRFHLLSITCFSISFVLSLLDSPLLSTFFPSPVYLSRLFSLSSTLHFSSSVLYLLTISFVFFLFNFPLLTF